MPRNNLAAEKAEAHPPPKREPALSPLRYSCFQTPLIHSYYDMSHTLYVAEKNLIIRLITNRYRYYWAGLFQADPYITNFYFAEYYF
ncbi:MAG: hypothetical protein CMP10_09315 [Zetaproteobacteria bacterium]|nr:hypothetical protein [Pseudobdellovibrionaceae bacterium]